jgi:hypothetical protein
MDEQINGNKTYIGHAKYFSDHLLGMGDASQDKKAI